MHRQLASALLTLLAGLTLAVTTPATVMAESQPIRVILAYVPTQSNWGPTEANGVALVSFSEGDVRADLVGLAPLNDGERYVLWLRDSAGGATMPLARFQPAVPGSVTYVDQELSEAIPDAGWDSLLVTVEQADNQSQTPSEQRSIVGSFPGTPAEVALYPPKLPQTGEIPAKAPRLPLALLAIDFMLLGVFLIRRVHQRGRAARMESK